MAILIDCATFLYAREAWTCLIKSNGCDGAHACVEQPLVRLCMEGSPKVDDKQRLSPEVRQYPEALKFGLVEKGYWQTSSPYGSIK